MIQVVQLREHSTQLCVACINERISHIQLQTVVEAVHCCLPILILALSAPKPTIMCLLLSPRPTPSTVFRRLASHFILVPKVPVHLFDKFAHFIQFVIILISDSLIIHVQIP